MRSVVSICPSTTWTGASGTSLLQRVHHPATQVTVALVGKYIDLPDAYLSVTEALRAGGFHHSAQVTLRWVESDLCTTPEGAAEQLGDVDAIVVPGGFGIRGVDGKVGALRHTRSHGIPTLGLCLGMQSMVIEYARHELGLTDAHSTEFEPDTANPVIATMAEQEDIVAGAGDLGGTMRLGSYDHTLVEGSLAARIYGATEVAERHRHRYEVNNAYRDRLEAAGLRVSGALPAQPGALPGGIRRARSAGAPVLHRHPGPSGAEVAPHPRTSAVRGTDRCGARSSAIHHPAGGGPHGSYGPRGDSPSLPPPARTPTTTRSDPMTLADAPAPRPVSARGRVPPTGMVFDIVRDTIEFAPGVQFDREYMRHPGAVRPCSPWTSRIACS